jgi:hypothetical protein
MKKTDALDKYLIPNDSRIYWKVVGGKVVLIDKKKREICDLNAVGNFIWQAAAKKKNIGKIIEDLGKRYKDTPKSVLHQDTLKFIKRLVGKNIFLLKTRPRRR